MIISLTKILQFSHKTYSSLFPIVLIPIILSRHMTIIDNEYISQPSLEPATEIPKLGHRTNGMKAELMCALFRACSSLPQSTAHSLEYGLHAVLIYSSTLQKEEQEPDLGLNTVKDLIQLWIIYAHITTSKNLFYCLSHYQFYPLFKELILLLPCY